MTNNIEETMVEVDDTAASGELKAARERHQEVQQAVKEARRLIHDLNQPLTTVMGNLELMLMKMSSDDPGRSKLKELVDQCERMRQLNIQLGNVIRSQDDDIRSGRE
jgi:signal transduction histidine kinase